MAHELEMVNGKAQMVFTGDRSKIWHKLGTEIPDNLTPMQTMEAAGLDWDVIKVPLLAPVAGVNVETGHSALIRSDTETCLDVVTNDWNPVQNTEAFEFFNEFIEAGDMKMDTAGSIRNGRMVWAMAKVNEGFTLPGGDEVESYLLFSNPHQYARSIDIKFTPVRVVCNNTLSMALAEVNERQVRMTHRREYSADRAKMVLGLARSKLDEYQMQAEFLASVKAPKENVVEFFKRVFPVLTMKADSKKEMSKTAALALETLDTQPGAEMSVGTWWSAFNSVTYLTSNVYGKTDETRFDSVMYGANASRNQKAMKLALEMAS